MVLNLLTICDDVQARLHRIDLVLGPVTQAHQAANLVIELFCRSTRHLESLAGEIFR